MSEDNYFSSPELSQTSQEKIRQIVKQNSSLSKQHTQELETVLTSATLRLKDEIQQTSFLEHVQRLQGYHTIQILNVVVVPFATLEEEPSAAFLEEVKRLVDICLSFCYTSNESQRLSFDYYMKALKFCFPTDLKVCSPTDILKSLLTLVQICLDGKFVELGEVKEETNFTLQSCGTNYLFEKLLKIFESRRNDESLVEIVDETIRLASLDAKIKNVQQYIIGKFTLQSEHMVSPVFLLNWMKLLELPNVSSGFALSSVKADDPRCTEIFGGVLVQSRSLKYESTFLFCLNVLEEMLRNGIEINIPHDKERLEIFFDYFKYFCSFPNFTATSLRLLAATNINNGILREVFDQFFSIDGGYAPQKAEAFDLGFKVLSLFPNGELLKRVLNLWKETFSNTPVYQNLACLLTFFVEESNSESAGRILDFLEWLPSPLLSLISLWQELLLCFIKLFPSTFQRRPEVLVFIHKTARLAVRVPAQHRQAYMHYEQLPTLKALEWLSQQKGAAELRIDMIWLLMCSRDRLMGFNKEFDIGVIKTLSLCPLPSNTKKHVCNELTNLAPSVSDSERMYLIKFIGEVTSSQSLESMDEILLEFLDFIKRYVDRKRTKNFIPVHILTQLSSLSKVPLSGARKKKLMQMLKKSGKGFLIGKSILSILENHQCTLEKRTNEYFDVLFSIITVTLEERHDLCKQLENSVIGGNFLNTEVLKVWTFVTAALIIGGFYKDKVDSHCCRYVLAHAWGFDFPFEILGLLSYVRSTAVRLTHLPKGRAKDQRISQDNSVGELDLLQSYSTIVRTVLAAEILSPSEKTILVKGISDVVLTNPETLSAINIEGALYNLLPFSGWRGNTSSIGAILLDFRCIVSLFNDSEVLNQLSRIPLDEKSGSLCWVLSTKLLELSSKRDFMSIFNVICSQQDLDQAFFQRLVPFVNVVSRNSKSLEDVSDLLKSCWKSCAVFPPK